MRSDRSIKASALTAGAAEVPFAAVFAPPALATSGGGSDPAISFDEHERLALAMLAIESSEAAEVLDAWRKIIASAPESTDIALVLLLAIAHAEDPVSQRASAQPGVA